MAAQETGRGNLLIQNARLIDGTGAPPKEDVSILIYDGCIAAIGRDVAGENAEKLDAEGLTVLPGLIDAHVHLYSVPGTLCRGDSLDVIRQLQRVHLRAYLACGVTTVVDFGSYPSEVRVIKRWLQAGQPGPRVLFLSPWFITPDGYLADMPGPTGVLYPPVASPGDVEERFEASKGLDAVGVKVFLESGFGSDSFPIHSPEMREAIREAAAKRGLPLYIHSWTEADGHLALDMGAYCLAHSNGLQSDEIVARVKAQSAYVTTTSSMPDAFSIHHDPSRLDDPLVQLVVPEIERATARQPESWDKLSRGFATMLAPDNASEAQIAAAAQNFGADIPAGRERQAGTVRKLHEAGVAVVAGSDSGNWPLISYFFHGPTTLREIELLGESGLSPMEAIQAATVVPARMLDLSDEIGTIEVGKQADLAIVRGDPLEDLGALRSIEWTVQRGIARTPQEWMEVEASAGEEVRA